jgi:hypothetical protein
MTDTKIKKNTHIIVKSIHSTLRSESKIIEKIYLKYYFYGAVYLLSDINIINNNNNNCF